MNKFERYMLMLQLNVLKEAKVQTAILKGESPSEANVKYGKLSSYNLLIQQAASDAGVICIP